MSPEDLLVERLIRRVEQANIFFLEKIGESIKKIKNLKPSEAQQLVQILKYGGNYEDIIKQLAKYTNLNIKDIDEIFLKYAERDRDFYKQFYKYRNLPFKESTALQLQREALTSIVKNEMYNFTRTNVLGYTINGTFHNLRDTYNQLLNTALLNVGQGKETFDSALFRILKDIGGSGLKTIEYESGRSIRLDSAIRMHLKGGLRTLHNENQRIIGEEIGADGVEISVHENPAPDHEKAQGRQFSNEEYDKLNNGLEAMDYTGEKITLDHDGKNGYRPISLMNCYHYVFSIILGVSEPEYSQEQLQKIIDDNNKGFELDGKHYTNYQGTQLQRRLETEIRKQKDIQILAKANDNDDLAMASQYKIGQLTRKYKKLSDVSGLPTKLERVKVSDYRRGSTKQFDIKAEMLYHTSNPEENARIYYNALKRQERIKNGEYNLNIIENKQMVHNINSENYIEGKSYFNIDIQEEQELVRKYAGTGFIPANSKGNLTNKEICMTDKIIGKYINKNTNEVVDTNSFVIHYSKKGVHIVPANYRGDKK